MKKFAAIVLCLCLSFTFVFTAFAENKLSIEFNNAEAENGEEFTVTAVVKNNPGFCYLKLKFNYDQELFTLVKTDNGTVSDDGFTVSDTAIVWDTAVDTIKTGTLLTLTFKSKTELNGSYTIGMQAVECINYDENDVDIEIKNSTVAFKEKPLGKTYFAGDADIDNSVTSADARLVLRASVGLETLSDVQKKIADIDKDNTVTSSDARMILRASVNLEELGEITF